MCKKMKRYYSKIKDIQREKTFDRNLKELIGFLNQFKRIPEKSKNPKLYAWMASLMTEHKKRRLDQKYVDQLNSVGFIWSSREFNWFNKADEIKKMLLEHKTIPAYDNHRTLYHWLNFNRDLFSKNSLPEDKKKIITDINKLIQGLQDSGNHEPVIMGSAKEPMWTQKLNDLIKFRKENPKSWPQIKTIDENEKKLGIWCQNLRHSFRINSLEETLLTKLKEIGFNFKGRVDNWKQKFEELKKHFQAKEKAPDSRNELYTWAWLQFNRFDDLTEEKQELLNSINFLKYIEEKSWNKRYLEFQQFGLFYKKTPTKKIDEKLYNWLSVQRARYKSGQLSKNQVTLLLKLGVDLSPIEKKKSHMEFEL